MFAPRGTTQHFCPAPYGDGCPGTVERSASAEKTCAGGLGIGVCGGPGGCGDCGTGGGPAFSARGGGAGWGGEAVVVVALLDAVAADLGHYMYG